MHGRGEGTAAGRSGVALRDHVTRHQALNSISIFNPVNGKERTEKERHRQREDGAVAMLFIAAGKTNVMQIFKILYLDIHTCNAQ
jgi:hypothetical protein